jgi:hypothetical protein
MFVLLMLEAVGLTRGQGRQRVGAVNLPRRLGVCGGFAATVYLEMWKRKNAYLAWWWDVMDYEELVCIAHTPSHAHMHTRIHMHTHGRCARVIMRLCG